MCALYIFFVVVKWRQCPLIPIRTYMKERIFAVLCAISSGHLFRMSEMLQLCFHLDICSGCPKCQNFLNSTNGKGFIQVMKSQPLIMQRPLGFIYFSPLALIFFSNKLNQQFFLFFYSLGIHGFLQSNFFKFLQSSVFDLRGMPLEFQSNFVRAKFFQLP